jgi:hypothetical protein
MKPGRYPLTIYQGNPLDITITWRDKDGDLVDLSGCRAKLQIKQSPDGAILGYWEDGNGIELGGSAGTIRILIKETEKMTWENGVWRLVIEPEDGESLTLIEGPAEVIAG